MTISVNTFFTDTLNTVDSVIGQYVQTTYQNLVSANSGVITLIFTFYICFIGYRFLTQTLNSDLMTITRHMVVMLIVYGLLMSWNLYNEFFYNIFTNEPNYIASVMTGGSVTSPNLYVGQAIDNIFNQGMTATRELFTQANWHDLLYLLYGVIVFAITMAMCIFALLLFIYAKMALAVALALGPMFLLFLLWDSTRGYFSAWLRKLFNFALVPIITCAILSLMLSVINVTLPELNVPPQSLQFEGMVPFLGLALATTLILSQVLPICSALSGGMTLASLSKAKNIANTAMQHSGVNYAAGKLKNAGQAGFKQLKNSFSNQSDKKSRAAESAKRNYLDMG